MVNEHYDVIIIGTGAGGGTLAHRLAPSGLRILMLERGGWLPREADNWNVAAVFRDGRYKAHETWSDAAGKPFEPGIHYFVGGNTKVYGAALLRFRREDFGELRHHGGGSPAWPFTYEDLAPYYLEAERLYTVHGERGSDPTEPPESAPYAYPAVRHEPRIQQLRDDFARLGLNPFPLPLGLRLNEAAPQDSACIRCATCDGFPCLVNAKADAQVVAVQPALRHPNVTLRTHSYVERLLTSATGREVTGVEVRHDGEEGTTVYRGSIVVVSCGAINSAALLLRSANEGHPNGLANGSDVVGRHYMCHNNSALLALSHDENPTRFQKTLAVNDYYFTDRDDADFPYPLGHIQMLGKSHHDMLRGDAPWIVPGLTLKAMARRALDFWLTSEDLPDPGNRVTLDREGRIQLHYRENNLEGHARLVQRLKERLKDLGCEHRHLFPQHFYLGKKIPIAGVAHQCGTVRFGNDPRTSALDVFCKAHELDNLYVVDGSFFPSSAAVNPALTIMANAMRVGDHLRERLGASR